MYYDNINKILYKKQPPVPWASFEGFLLVEDSLTASQPVHKKPEETRFIYHNKRDYNNLVDHLRERR